MCNFDTVLLRTVPLKATNAPADLGRKGDGVHVALEGRVKDEGAVGAVKLACGHGTARQEQ